MIISRGRSYCFVHIPKTGGTSMALALEERAMADDVLIGDTPKALKRRRRLDGLRTRGRLWKHSSVAEAEGLLTPEDFDQLTFFTLVRNPWDRVASYYYWLLGQTFDHPAVHRAKGGSFEDFVLDPELSASFEATPVRHYLSTSEGRELPAILIRLEHLQADLAPLEAHLGFPIVMRKVNVSERNRDYRPLYTPAAAERIARICAEDIARFGYKFD